MSGCCLHLMGLIPKLRMKYLKYNHQTKSINHFLDRLSHERLTSYNCQSVHKAQVRLKLLYNTIRM